MQGSSFITALTTLVVFDAFLSCDTTLILFLIFYDVFVIRKTLLYDAYVLKLTFFLLIKDQPSPTHLLNVLKLISNYAHSSSPIYFLISYEIS